MSKQILNEQPLYLSDDDLMLMGWQRLYYDNDPNHHQVKDSDPLRKTLDLDNYDWWVGDLLGNLVPKEAVLNYWNTKNAPASNATLEKRWEDEASKLDLLKIEKALQHRRNKQFSKDADTVFIKAPLTLLGLGIGGAALAPWLTSALATPTGQALMYGSLGGEALNFTSQLGGYDNFGHLIYNTGGGENWRNLPEWQKTLWNFTNPGYLISGPASKAADLTIEGLRRAALNKIQLDPSKYGTTAWKTSWYNNITPGSYSAKISWHPKGKVLGEIPNALKDYVTGKGAVKNPKWELYFLSNPNLWQDFPNGNAIELHTALRKEAAELYSRLKRSTNYLIDTGKVDENGYKIFTLDLNKIPKENVQDFVMNVNPTKNKTGVTMDLANFGGNVRYTTDINPELHTFQITSDDIFDVNPLKNPNRIAESLPTTLRNILFKKITNPSGSDYPYSYTHRWYTKPFKNFELGQLTGAKPFRVITTVDGKFVSEYPFNTNLASSIERTLAKNKLIAQTKDKMSDLVPWEELSEQEIIRELNLIKERATKYVEGLSDELLLEKLQGRMSAHQYLDKTGQITFPSEEYGISVVLQPSEREKLLQQVRDLNSLVQGKDIFEIFGTPLYKEAEKLIKQINESKHPIDLPLNWSSKNWFASRPKGLEPTAEEIAEFEANIPEYLEIQKNAGENWLKMPDGSIWQGDPREWVMMLSKAYKDLMQDSKFTTPMTHLMSDFRGDRVIEVPSTGASRLWGNGFYGHINPTGKLNTNVSTTSSTYPIVAAEPQSTFVVNAKNPVTLSYKDLTPRALDLNARHSTDRVGSFHNLSFEGSGPYLENDIGIAPKGKAVIGFPNDQGIAYPLLKFVTGNTGRFSKDPNSSLFRSIFPLVLGGSALYGITPN